MRRQSDDAVCGRVLRPFKALTLKKPSIVVVVVVLVEPRKRKLESGDYRRRLSRESNAITVETAQNDSNRPAPGSEIRAQRVRRNKKTGKTNEKKNNNESVRRFLKEETARKRRT